MSAAPKVNYLEKGRVAELNHRFFHEYPEE
jgi:hypothetical protein